ELRKHLGLFKGSMAGIFLKKEFEAPYVDFPPNTGSIEFVGTASKFRGQGAASQRSEEHTSELQSRFDLVCRLLLEKKKTTDGSYPHSRSATTRLSDFRFPCITDRSSVYVVITT